MNERAAVFHTQNIIGRRGVAEDKALLVFAGFFPEKMLKCRSPGSGKGHSALESCLQFFPVYCSAFGGAFSLSGCNGLCTAHEVVKIAALGAEAQIGDNTQLLQKIDAAACKIFRAPACRIEGDLQDQVCPGLQNLLCADIFVENGGFAALYEVTAHGGDDIVCLCDPARLAQNECMTFVKRVAFHNDACNFHRFQPFVCCRRKPTAFRRWEGPSAVLFIIPCCCQETFAWLQFRRLITLLYTPYRGRVQVTLRKSHSNALCARFSPFNSGACTSNVAKIAFQCAVRAIFAV